MQGTHTSEIHAFIINLDRSQVRCRHTQQQLNEAGISHTRIKAIDGAKLTLPHPQYHERAYRLKHGKQTNLGELGCHLSHLEVYKAFLETELTHALVCEDDVTIPTNALTVLTKTLNAQSSWDIIKISRVSSSIPIHIEPLIDGYSLAINLGRHTGSGAYLINRRAAKDLLGSLNIMTIPFDHAFDKEWLTGFRAYSIQPALIKQDQTGFKPTIISPRSFKLPSWRRYWTIFPYRFITELSRVVYRSLRILFAIILLKTKGS